MLAIRIGLLAAALAFAAPALAAPCSGFTDVDDSSSFCPNVDWLKNRGITLGCTSATLYCPGDPVSRLAMAALLNRLGTALTPTTHANEFQDLSLNLTGGPVVCTTGDLPITGFPRSFMAWGFVSAKGDLNEDVLVHFVRSSDGGTTWVAMNQFGTTLSLRTPVWNTATVISSPQSAPSFNLNVGSTYQFGLRILRLANLPNITAFHCHLIVELRNRQGSTSPFDAR